MNKTAIKNCAIWARRKLISDITYRAGMLGITENGIAQPMKQSTKDLQFFDIGTKDYVEISGDQIQQRNALISVIRSREKGSDYKTAFRGVVEEVAYTWFNRLIAVRFMEVNDYLPSGVRVLSSLNPNKLEPDLVTTPFDTDLEFTPYERDLVLQLKEQNRLDELFRMLFIMQCNRLSRILPELFEQISDYTELLLTISFTDKDGVVYHLTHDIGEDDFNVGKEGQVEIIGWLYQYYNTEPKDEVFALLKKNVKITKERIPAATQLFTPDWIVRYMVENSLGRLWVEGHPNEGLKANWKYYLEEAEQEPEVQAQLAVIREGYAKLSPEEIKVIDPCMGSGHILVYAFDVLMQIYLSCGYTKQDAAKSILRNNLYGIDIDTRAYQLAYFAVMMKARQYSRKIFDDGILPNLIAVKNPAPCSASALKRLGDLEPLGKRLIEDFRDAEEYGSILQLSYTKEELDALDARLDDIDRMADYGNLLVQYESIECVDTIAPLVRQARILGQKYDVVVTNPPYMSNGGMGSNLSQYVKAFFPDSKSDLCTVFIEHGFALLKPNGFEAMITMESWMFLSSFEKLRIWICEKKTIRSLIHMPYLGKGGTSLGINFGTEVAIIQNANCQHYAGIYDRISYYETDEAGVPYEFPTQNEYYQCKCQEDYSVIPGSPIAYWVSNSAFACFKNHIKISDIAIPVSGTSTGDNSRFLRLWPEVEYPQIARNTQPMSVLTSKWFPCNKGGEYRKWYGNLDYIIDWENDGYGIKNNRDETGYLKSRPLNLDKLFYPGVTWSKLGSGDFSVRFQPAGSIWESIGCGLMKKSVDLFLLTALLNTKVADYLFRIINPSMGRQPGYVGAIPFISGGESEKDIMAVTSKCIAISRDDWNSFETSWDYQEHPLVRLSKGSWNASMIRASMQFGHEKQDKNRCPLEVCYLLWKDECNDRFQQLKSNEEWLNNIFIKIYGLQDDLMPEVEDKDVTVRKADLKRDIKSLISYAVGCMFGRYSLDAPGLAFAGGEWDDGKYSTFIPDPDNCIPITDEEYFRDDIVGRFVEFIRVVYGADTLEENLSFIAEALGNSGKTARETIRQYFLRDFFKDHCQTYSVTGSGKRPIYWLFDSGKQNGFKALVYMHRWNADTVGHVRVEYLHKMQGAYEREIEICRDAVENSPTSREKAAAAKRMEKLVSQLKECRDYDAKIAHIALARIDIDLDDGVKVNYRKVQTAADGRFCEILADSKDIMVKEDSPIWQSLISNRSQTS